MEDSNAAREAAWWWTEPPQEMLGRTVPVAGALRSASVALHLPHVVAYPSGLVLPLRLMARRRNIPDAQWDAMGALIGRPGREDEGRGRVPASPGRPRFTVRAAGGFEAAMVLGGNGRPGEWDPVFALRAPDGPVLQQTEADGDFELDQFTMILSLWLVPLPPADDLTFNVEWVDAGFAGTVVLDGAAIVQAAQECSPVWPGD